MKRLFKTTLCVALCAVLLLCSAAPAFALTDNYSFIDYADGVNVECNSVLNSIRAKGTITLSFVPGVNHLPQSDYTCGVKIKIYYTNGSSFEVDSGDVSAMTTNTSKNHSPLTASSAEYTYRVNNTNVYGIPLSF